MTIFDMTALLLAVKNQTRTLEKMSSTGLSLWPVFCDQRTMTIMKNPEKKLKRLLKNIEISLSEYSQSSGNSRKSSTEEEWQTLRPPGSESSQHNVVGR